MAIPRHHRGIRGDMCQCGRKESLLHCPECGSAQVRSRHNEVHKFLDGHEEWVKIQHVCNLCGRLFVASERKFCSATPIDAADAARKLQILAQAEGNPTNTPDEQAAAATAKRMIEDFKKAGVVPSTQGEAQAFSRLEQIAGGDEFDNLRIEQGLREAYVLECKEYEASGQKHPETLDGYIDRRFTQDFPSRTRPKKE